MEPLNSILRLQFGYLGVVILYCVGIVILISTRTVKGRGWLIVSMLLTVVGQMFYYIPETLTQLKIMLLNSQSNFFEAVNPITQLLYTLSDGALIAFIFNLRLTSVEGTTAAHALFAFNGRVRRSTFWIFYFAMMALNLRMISTLMDLTANNKPPTVALVVVCLIWFPLAVWIGLAVQVKRWHDRNKSGWWVLIPLVPFIGGIWALVENGFLEGTNGPNQYGPDPADVNAKGFQTERILT